MLCDEGDATASTLRRGASSLLVEKVNDVLEGREYEGGGGAIGPLLDRGWWKQDALPIRHKSERASATSLAREAASGPCWRCAMVVGWVDTKTSTKEK